MNSADNQQLGKSILFISELPDNIMDSELEEFFSAYKEHIFMMQIDRNQKMYDLFNTRKPRATIIFKSHEKAEEARNELNMRRLKGKPLNIMWHERDNTIRYNNKANIFVKGISPDAKPRDIYELFAKYGEIISTKICEDEDGNLLGYGYINYYNLDSAENAIKNLNKKKFCGSELEILHFQKKNERIQSTLGNNSIYIKNLPNSITESEIKKIFSKFGKITWGKIIQDKNDRPFAILVFEEVESATKAKEEMNDKKINESDELALYVDALQKKSERKRLLTTKIGDITNKLNQEFKNCNLYIKNLPYDLTEEKLKDIFSAYGEVKSVKISKYLLVSKVKDDFVEKETSRGFGYVCYSSPEHAEKAIAELNGKNLPGYENNKRPLIINLFMPRNERKQILNKIQTPTSQRFPYQMAMQMPGMPQYGMPYANMPYPRQIQHNRHQGNYRRPQQPPQAKKVQPPQPQPVPVQPAVPKEDEPSLKFLESLDTKEAKIDYLGEYLFKKIEHHPIANKKQLTVEIISRITGMILGIDDVKEIYEITVNNDSIASRIEEALTLLGEKV